MPPHSEIPKWAPKVPRAKIRRLYTTDAQGIVDKELLDEVGWRLWSRCDSILTVTASHYGRVPCPACGTVIQRGEGDEPAPWSGEDTVECGSCNWRLPWKTYHQTYRGRQLFGANAVPIFEDYHRAFPQAEAPNAKMLLIDQLIHAFHSGLIELGRPVGANLIEGSLKEVILFLDGLTNGAESASGIQGSHNAWRRNLESTSWAHLFIGPGAITHPKSPD